MIYAYEATFTYDDDGACWYVDFPMFDGSCYTDGDTIEQAVANAADVLSLTIADYIDSGLELPRPSFHNPPRTIVCVDVDDEYIARTNCMTFGQAAEELGVSPSRVSQLAKAGRLETRTIGGRTYVTIASVNDRKANPPAAHRPTKVAAIA